MCHNASQLLKVMDCTSRNVVNKNILNIQYDSISFFLLQEVLLIEGIMNLHLHSIFRFQFVCIKNFHRGIEFVREN